MAKARNDFGAKTQNMAKSRPSSMSRVHVLPLNDLIEHEESEDCICGPDVELVSALDDGWLILHHSLDGREENE